MREGLIILPRTVPEQYHGALAVKLVDAFGGYTAVEARGAWRDPVDGKIYDEPVVQYNVAYDVNPLDGHDFGNGKKLGAIAEWLLTETSERAIYFKFADGTVKIIHK